MIKLKLNSLMDSLVYIIELNREVLKVQATTKITQVWFLSNRLQMALDDAKFKTQQGFDVQQEAGVSIRVPTVLWCENWANHIYFTIEFRWNVFLIGSKWQIFAVFSFRASLIFTETPFRFGSLIKQFLSRPYSSWQLQIKEYSIDMAGD